VSVDGRPIRRGTRRRTNPYKLEVSGMVSVDKGNFVEGKLIFARLV